MKHGSLFSGIGGFDLAAQWMGWENVFQVEWDGFCQKVLAKNFPNVKRYGDIKEFDGTKYRGTIDIITGGFPCQGFSVAGKQRGKSDPRYLWPEMLRVIREIQPSGIVGENVSGIIKLELEDICIAMESEGYEVQPFIIPSASIGAWDKRDRVWIIAHNGLFRQAIHEKQAVGSEQCTEINFNTISTGLQRYSGNDLSSRDKEQERQAGQANWSRPWIEVASELCRSNARVPHGMDRIKALGNSVNPYVVFQIFKAIEQLNESP